jgi:hypothetical protein
MNSRSLFVFSIVLISLSVTVIIVMILGSFFRKRELSPVYKITTVGEFFIVQEPDTAWSWSATLYWKKDGVFWGYYLSHEAAFISGIQVRLNNQKVEVVSNTEVIAELNIMTFEFEHIKTRLYYKEPTLIVVGDSIDAPIKKLFPGSDQWQSELKRNTFGPPKY